MRKLFTLISIIFAFVFICSCIHTIHGESGRACVSSDPIPENFFHPNQYNTLRYVKVVSLELARNIHQKLGLKAPTDYCRQLAGMKTSHPNNMSMQLVRTDDVTDPTYQLLGTMEALIINMINYFNTNRDLINIQLQPNDDIALYDSINLAIRRLHNCGHYGTRSTIVEFMRRLKRTFTGNCIHEGLYINGQRLTDPPRSTTQLFYNSEFLTVAIEQFLQQVVIEVPEQNSLYISRNEIAITQQGDPNVEIAGSDGARQCIIVILIHRVTKAVGVTSICDVARCQEAVDGLLDQLNPLYTQAAATFSLYLIGGYTNVARVFYAIMESFHLRMEDIHIMLVCVGEFNTTTYNGNESPRITGAAIDLNPENNLRVFPAFFHNRGPDQPLRLARVIVGRTDVINIYHYNQGWVSIECFNYEYNDAYATQLLRLRDSQLQGMFPGTIEAIPAALLFLQDHPSANEAFPDQKARYFQRDENGCWMRVPIAN